MIYIFAILSAILNWIAQILWKIWLNGFDFKEWFIELVFSLCKNIYFLFWCFLYLLSIFIWFVVLSKIEVSKAYPFLALSYIIIMIWWYMIWESINLYKILGIFFIIVWIIFISKS